MKEEHEELLRAAFNAQLDLREAIQRAENRGVDRSFVRSALIEAAAVRGVEFDLDAFIDSFLL